MITEEANKNLTRDAKKNELQELRKELEEQKKLAEDRLNKLKYLHADFDNYRKKFEKEKENIIDLANENIIKEMLTVIDDFERSLNEIKEEKTKKGLELVFKNLLKILEKNGLKRIEALGKQFDPNFHEALVKEKSNKEGEVLEEFQKGFMLKSKLIRPSRVKIAEKET